MLTHLSQTIAKQSRCLVFVSGMTLFTMGIGRVTAQPESKQKSAARDMLIEPDMLEKHLQKHDLRILDTRSQKAYSSQHIPGALWVDVAKWRSLAKSEGGFHKANEWGQLIGGLGINNKSAVVVYGDSLSNTARVWWLLKYAGLKDVRILNGNWPLWLKQERPTTKKVGAVGGLEFTPKFQADRLEEIGTLKKSLKEGKVKVVDTRSEGEFTGKIVRGKRGGHIPNAVHLEWKELVAKDGRFKTKEELRKLFEARGLKPNQKLVCY